MMHPIEYIHLNDEEAMCLILYEKIYFIIKYSHYEKNRQEVKENP